MPERDWLPVPDVPLLAFHLDLRGGPLNSSAHRRAGVPASAGWPGHGTPFRLLAGRRRVLVVPGTLRVSVAAAVGPVHAPVGLMRMPVPMLSGPATSRAPRKRGSKPKGTTACRVCFTQVAGDQKGPPPKRRGVLVVDDDGQLTELLRVVLDGEGREVTVVADLVSGRQIALGGDGKTWRRAWR